MRVVLLSFFLFFVSLSVRAADWSLEIVPTDVTARGAGISLDQSTTPQFHVILTNTSGHTLKIWKEWCSAGWWNLSFRVRREDGTTFEIRKGGHSWSWNYPDPYLVLPERSFIWSVKFDKDWNMPDDLRYPMAVQLTAVFEEDNEEDWKKDILKPKEETRLLRRQKVLEQKLHESPYDLPTVRELQSIERQLYYTLIAENLWIGKVRSKPFSVILENTQKE